MSEIPVENNEIQIDKNTDLTGMKFGRLLVKSKSNERLGGAIAWNCLCDCGKECLVRGTLLRQGKTKSCGCLKSESSSKRNSRDITGLKFHKLTPIKPVGSIDYKVNWLCKCDCGNYKIVPCSYITSGKTKSCGCLQKEVMLPKLFVDITGQKFGLLTVIEPTEERKHRQVVWKCLCACGNYAYANSTDLKSNKKQSCGCLQSKGEMLIAKYLTENNIKFQKQYNFKDLNTVRNGRLKFDFGIMDDNNNLLYLIEFQGEQHYRSTSRNGFGDMQRLETDDLKREYCKENNISLYEIRYDEDIEKRMNEIMHTYANSVGSELSSQPVSTISESGE